MVGWGWCAPRGRRSLVARLSVSRIIQSRVNSKSLAHGAHGFKAKELLQVAGASVG